MTRPVLIFDLDGTLADPRRGILRCIRHTLVQFGVDPPPEQELERFIGPPLVDAFTAMLGSEAAVDAVRFFRESYGTSGLFDADIYEGVESALRDLRELSPALYVATSKPRVFAERMLAHFELARFFRRIYGSEMNGDRAPKHELLVHVMEHEKLGRASTFMVGDRMHDALAARTIGIGCVGVTWGFGSEDELRDAGANPLCATVEDLVRWYRDGIIAARP